MCTAFCNGFLGRVLYFGRFRNKNTHGLQGCPDVLIPQKSPGRVPRQHCLGHFRRIVLLKHVIQLLARDTNALSNGPRVKAPFFGGVDSLHSFHMRLLGLKLVHGLVLELYDAIKNLVRVTRKDEIVRRLRVLYNVSLRILRDIKFDGTLPLVWQLSTGLTRGIDIAQKNCFTNLSRTQVLQ